MKNAYQTQATAADPHREAAYRRLALTILGLDVPTLAAKLQAERRQEQPLPQAA